MDIKTFQEYVAEMKKARDWNQFHQPKDLLLGMIEEMGEFRNLIKWEQNPEEIRKILVDGPKERRDEVVDFFGDMMWYLGSLADYCGVDISEAMEMNIGELQKRFPIEKVKGSTANPVTGGFDGKYEGTAKLGIRQ